MSSMKKSSKNYVFSIFNIILCTYSVFSMLATISYALDTISPTQSLSDGQTIVSSGGTFELGFFSPPGTSSSNQYIGIWYKKISNGTVVWIGNRDSPLTDTSGGGVLKLTDGGVLNLVNSTNTIFWSSMNSSSSNSSVVNPVAQLLDSGNLVVKDANGGNLLWQSFDHPTDTMLPGMKLGKDFLTGIDRHIWSWKSSDDPSTGDYNFGFDLRGYPQLIILKGAVEQYRSGSWNGQRFSGSVGLKRNNIYRYYFNFTETEVYYVFYLVNSSVYSRLVLNPNGILQRFTWNNIADDWTTYVTAPADNCDSYELCHAYGCCNIANSPACGCLDKFVPKNQQDWETAVWSGGCVRRTPLNCHNESSNGFIKYSGIKLPDTRYSWFNRTMSLQECKEVCSKNCTCMAYANIEITSGGSGCLLWFDDLIDIRVLPETGQDIYIRMASSELVSEAGSQSNGNTRKALILSMALVAGVSVLGLTLALYIWKKKYRKKKLKRERFERGLDQGNTSESNKEDLELPIFDLLTIANATDNFSTGNKLGEGGFGPVYKGVLEEGREIAVKRLSKYSTQGGDEFKNEVICIAKLQHRNLVKLLGCCFQGEEKMLIYEYMPNKSLDLFIFNENQSKLLDWPKRFDIINGIARGLLYLHQDSRLRIIHRDLKASNILLDANMIPKISDFGVARSCAENETGATTKRVVGTHGYMSPEYAVDGVFSVKSDVFSFGVLVLEIVTGKRNRGFCHPDHHLNLLGHSWRLFMEGRSLELVDTPIEEASCYLSQVQRSIHIALLCVQQDPEDRPNMSSVVLMLGSEGALLQPKQPGFYTERSFPEIDYYSSSKNTTSSVNEITMTVLVAR